jgi:hypothetical protein
MRRIAVCLACLTLPAVPAAAQPFIDLASAAMQPWLSEEGERVSWLTAQLTAPLKVGDDRLVIGSGFEHYGFDGGADLYGFSLPVAWVHQRNDRWKIAGSVITRLHSDLEAVSGDDWQAGGALLFTKKCGPSFDLKFGAYYNAEFFGPYFLPLLGIDWRVNPRWNLAGVLPNNLLLEYKVSPGKFHAGLSFRAVTHSYRTTPNAYLRVFDNQLKVFADGYLAKNVVLGAEAGRSFFRKYEAGFRSGGEKTETELLYGDDFFVRIVAAFRLRLDDPGK